MQRNYKPNNKMVSMIGNDIDQNKHQTINQQIDEFFSKGGKIIEIAPSCSALIDRPADPFVINPKKNAERKLKETDEFELEPCN